MGVSRRQEGNAMVEDIEKVRTLTDAEDEPMLFPMAQYSRPPRSPESLCKEMGLNWYTALKLYEDGWISFDPNTVETLNDWQEAELSFVGSLVTGGCDGAVLRHLLARLHKPYSYHISRMYYDWREQKWRLLEDVDDLDERFEEWVQELIAWHELDRLEGLRVRLDSAILQLSLSPGGAMAARHSKGVPDMG